LANRPNTPHKVFHFGGPRHRTRDTHKTQGFLPGTGTPFFYPQKGLGNPKKFFYPPGWVSRGLFLNSRGGLHGRNTVSIWTGTGSRNTNPLGGATLFGPFGGVFTRFFNPQKTALSNILSEPFFIHRAVLYLGLSPYSFWGTFFFPNVDFLGLPHEGLC